MLQANVPKDIFGCPSSAQECDGEQREGTWAKLKCKAGHTGILCNVCAEAPVRYGKKGNACVECSKLTTVLSYPSLWAVGLVIALIVSSLFYFRKLKTRKDRTGVHESLTAGTTDGQVTTIWQNAFEDAPHSEFNWRDEGLYAESCLGRRFPLLGEAKMALVSSIFHPVRKTGAHPLPLN